MSSRYDTILKRSRIAFSLRFLLLAIASSAAAENVKNYTRARLDECLARPQPPEAGLKPGEDLTSRDIARIWTYLLPGYVERLDFPEFRAEIIATRTHRPRKDYLDCAEKHQAQVKLNPDGSLSNMVCGQPFSSASISTTDPLSGIKAAWNFEYRWQTSASSRPTLFISLTDSAADMPDRLLFGNGYPNATEEHVRRLFDINKLEEVRR
jgi:hypothetical protein